MTTTEKEIEELKVKIKEVEDKIKEVEQDFARAKEDFARAKKDGNEKFILMYGNNLVELRKQYNHLFGLISIARSTTGR